MPAKKKQAPTTSPATVLVLRSCRADMTSTNGFRWPEAGPVSCPDWDPKPYCGNGLHGWLWGEGEGDQGYWEADAKWLVVSVAEKDIINLRGKVKFQSGEVVFCGDRLAATEYIRASGATGRAVIGASVTAGDGGTATAGDRGTATAGDGGTATAGDGGTATAGDGGTATAGDGGTATAGHRGTATAGYGGTATAGDGGTATAGDGGTIQISWWDSSASRKRIRTGYVGEDGLLPNVAYRLVEGEWFAVKEDD